MTDIKTKIWMNDLAADGPIRDPEELTRRANIVLFNYLGTYQKMIVENLDLNAEDHEETKQVLAEAFRQTEHLKLALRVNPHLVFLSIEEDNTDA